MDEGTETYFIGTGGKSRNVSMMNACPTSSSVRYTVMVWRVHSRQLCSVSDSDPFSIGEERKT